MFACVHVKYVHLKVSIVELSAVEGVIYVCAPRRVHTAHSQLPQVLSLHHVLLRHASTLKG